MNSSNVPASDQPSAAAPVKSSALRGDVVVLLIAMAASIIVFANSLGGEFVYDDHHQIVGNELIKRPELLPRALTSDVFAFKGQSDEPWSNYWRPTFVAWLALNYQLFGQRPAFWHITNLLLHCTVIFSAWGLLRELRVPRWLLTAVLLTFAVHPVHVESVTWISGSTDMLMSAPMLAAAWMVLRFIRTRSIGLLIGACVMYAIAQLAKEPAIVTPAIVFALTVIAGDANTPFGKRLMRAVMVTLPFAAITALYLVARVMVLGRIGPQAMPWDTGLGGVVMTAPSVGAFYLRQVFCPFWMGPSYPLRAVTTANAGMMNLLVPLAICAVSAMVALALARRSVVQAVGLLLFVLPLAPAMNLNAFVPEQIVHDRYLYLPLLGMLMLFWPAASGTLQWLARIPAAKAGSICAGLAILLCIPLAAKTITYNRAWMKETALWQSAVESDPTSSANWTELGRVHKEARQFDQSIEALDKALSIAPVTLAYVNRAEVFIEKGRYADAERDLRTVLNEFPDHFPSWERLALMYERQGNLEQSLQTLRDARSKVPGRRCVLTDMMAIVLVQMNRPAEAIAELESIRAEVPNELNEHAAMALYRLGVLYAMTGKRSEAEQTLQEFVQLTKVSIDPEIVQTRNEIEGELGRR